MNSNFPFDYWIIQSLKYLRSWTFGCKDIGIILLEFCGIESIPFFFNVLIFIDYIYIEFSKEWRLY